MDQGTRDPGSVDFHGPRRTEFLATEAADTAIAVDHRAGGILLPAARNRLHADGLGGADVGAFSTADALTCLEFGAGGQEGFQGLARQFPS